MKDYKKKYEEALERAREYWETDNDNTLAVKAKGTMEYLFPELKESEHEKMQNFISHELACLRASDEKGSDRYEELTNAIAWLEKQGEQPDANKEYWRGYREGKQEIIDKYSDIEKQGEQKPVLGNALKEAFDKSRKDYSLEEKKEASDYSESIIPTSITYGESEEEYMLHKIIEAAFIAGKNNEQKPTWSEEDEGMYIFTIKILNNIHYKDNANWLKSLKERMKGK